ncbi:MAG: CinA family protein [Dermatophilaceae bacterium]|nr:CinA family protein [Dermatophilaceae bacterium]
MDQTDIVERIAEAAGSAGLSVGAAESLTGGAISQALAAGPDSSEWFRGAIVAYSTDVKVAVLDVRPGPVITEDCARSMASGASRALGADVTVAVTGAGGPGPEEGQPSGTVWFAWAVRGDVSTACRHFDGDPQAVVEQTTLHALHGLERALASVAA